MCFAQCCRYIILGARQLPHIPCRATARETGSSSVTVPRRPSMHAQTATGTWHSQRPSPPAVACPLAEIAAATRSALLRPVRTCRLWPAGKPVPAPPPPRLDDASWAVPPPPRLDDGPWAPDELPFLPGATSMRTAIAAATRSALLRPVRTCRLWPAGKPVPAPPPPRLDDASWAVPPPPRLGLSGAGSSKVRFKPTNLTYHTEQQQLRTGRR